MKEAFPFAQYLGMTQLKAHATEVTKRVANSRAVTAARSVIAPKTEKTSARADGQNELPPPTDPVASASALTESEIDDINVRERQRGAEIMAAAIANDSPKLGLALLESGISAKSAIHAIATARQDLSGPVAAESAAPPHPRKYVSSNTRRPI